MSNYPYIPRDGFPLIEKILKELKKIAKMIEEKETKRRKDVESI